jgi:hypothetical protein
MNEGWRCFCRRGQLKKMFSCDAKCDKTDVVLMSLLRDA